MGRWPLWWTWEEQGRVLFGFPILPLSLWGPSWVCRWVSPHNSLGNASMFFRYSIPASALPSHFQHLSLVRNSWFGQAGLLPQFLLPAHQNRQLLCFEKIVLESTCSLGLLWCSVSPGVTPTRSHSVTNVTVTPNWVHLQFPVCFPS